MTPNRYTPLYLIALGLVGCATTGNQDVTERATGPATAAAARGQYAPLGTRDREMGWHRTTLPASRSDAGDLWSRVRTRLSPREGNARIERQAQAIARDRSYLRRLSVAAAPVLRIIIEEIEKRGLPGELALLPHVESRFNPAATSPKAAAGIWQFIPSTGQAMGLRQSADYDGRRDLIESTRAGLDYLEQLHRQLGGSWELAMAAYNCGPGRVASAQASNRARGLPTDFWSLRLPAETENYVPAILGLARLVRAPGDFGLTLPPVPDHPQLEVVVAEGVPLDSVARASGVALAVLRQLNPGLKQGRAGRGPAANIVVPAGAGHRVVAEYPAARVVPAQVSRREQDEAGILNPIAVQPAIGEGMAYRVAAGETLGSVARQFGVSVSQLREWNRHADDGITEGEAIQVFPGSGYSQQGYSPDGRAAQGTGVEGGLARAG